MAGYSAAENVRKVIIVGLADKESRGLTSSYDDSVHDRGVAIPEDDDWTGKQKQLRVRPDVGEYDIDNNARKKSSMHFNVNIPSNFFDESDRFISSPSYKINERLHVKLTGQGLKAGYIDMNVNGRGGGTSSDTNDEGCAKWS